MLIVSPYAKAGTVDHTQAELSSVLKFIETDYNLPPLTQRDSKANDLTQDFDFTQSPLAFPSLQQRESTPNSDAGCLEAYTTCNALSSVPGRGRSSQALVHQVAHACTSTQITTAVQDCWTGPFGYNALCNTFFSTPANASCVACLNAPSNTGGVITDSNGHFWPNTGGCMALTEGSDACGSAYEPLEQCLAVACGSTACIDALSTSTTVYSSCLSSARAGALRQHYVKAAEKACAANLNDAAAPRAGSAARRRSPSTRSAARPEAPAPSLPAQ